MVLWTCLTRLLSLLTLVKAMLGILLRIKLLLPLGGINESVNCRDVLMPM